MNLIEAFMENCIFMEKKRVPDGAGGFHTSWTEGMQFRAAVTLDTSLEARQAERSGTTSVYTVTTSRSMTLSYHDVFKRMSDGKIFRVTSDGGDKKTPKTTDLDMSQVTAEKWELTA